MSGVTARDWRLAASVALALLASLAMASPSSASGPASGLISFSPATECEFAIQTGTVSFVGFPLNLTGFLGGTSLEDRDVGFTCAGPVGFMALPITPPLTVTGLTCAIFGDPFTTYPTGYLSSSGTAIFFRDGTAKLICPPSPRS